jgi:guanine nucleotide-binding protein G(i) subunit alpha
MARAKASGIQEYKFDLGSLGVHMFSIGVQRLDKKKFIHQFENITSIVFSVDLSGYDQVLPDGSNQNQIIESLQVFDSVVNSRWFLRTSVILLFCNAGRFKRKLARSPMSRQFPDYTGGSDVAQASKYIFWRFNQLNGMDLSLFPHLCEASGMITHEMSSRLYLLPCWIMLTAFSGPSDTSNITVVFAAIKDTIIFNAMKDSGIPVERKNSAASAASSSRKGSNDTLIGSEKGRGPGDDDDKSGRKEKEQMLEGDTLQGEKDGEDDVKEEWREDIGNHGDQNNDGAKEVCYEPTPSEIGVAL